MSSVKYFREMRLKRGLTQEDVATFLGYTSKQIVSNWERGVCMPPLNKLAALVKLLDLDKDLVLSIFMKETEEHLKKCINQKKRSA